MCVRPWQLGPRMSAQSSPGWRPKRYFKWLWGGHQETDQTVDRVKLRRMTGTDRFGGAG